MICNNCGRPLPNGSTYCPYCGAKHNISGLCPRCGSKLPEDAAFCIRCGTNVSEGISEVENAIIHSGSSREPFYRKWTAEHRQLAETKRITWISEFKEGYAVAIDDNAPGRELRPFLVRGENIAETVCYMSWAGANVANGVIEADGDCFRNGTRFISFILFRSSSMISQDEYKRILRAFTGLTTPLSTSGIALLLARDGRLLFASQYQENVTGIADIFPIRMIGSKYCLYTSPEEYNKMTNRERYTATSEVLKTASQNMIDCDTGASAANGIFVPKYDGDPSGSFVEYFNYDGKVAEVMRSRSEKDKRRGVFNRRTGNFYRPGDPVRYKAVRIEDNSENERFLLLKMSDIRSEQGLRGMTETGAVDVIDENDSVVLNIGRCDLQNTPQITGAGSRIFIAVRSPEVPDADGKPSCANNCTVIYGFDKDENGCCRETVKRSITAGADFADGIVHLHTADNKTETLSGAFTVGGKTYILLLKEREEAAEEFEKCLLVDHDLNKVASFNYRQHYGSQTPYGVHIFGDTVYSLSSEVSEPGNIVAVMKDIGTGEAIFRADPTQLISNASAEFGSSRIRPRYEFGSYRAGGNICFLVGKQNRGLGIMDFHGRKLIPIAREHYFIVSSAALGMIGEGTKYTRLPADTFLVVLDSFDSDSYRVCGANGDIIFEGNMAKLLEKFS